MILPIEMSLCKIGVCRLAIWHMIDAVSEITDTTKDAPSPKESRVPNGQVMYRLSFSGNVERAAPEPCKFSTASAVTWNSGLRTSGHANGTGR